MIHDIIKFLAAELAQHLKTKTPSDLPVSPGGEAPSPDVSVDPPAFQNEAVNILLLNLEEEKTLRPPNPYVQLNKEGMEDFVSPPLRLDATVLFAAKFSDYLNALKHLSLVIQFFQVNPIFTASRFPAMPASLDKLMLELHSFTHAQKNEIWSSLKTAYLPSIAYRLRLLVFQEDRISLDGEITETQIQINQQ